MTKAKGLRTQKKYCDYRCWNAIGGICTCWCEGANHGIGKIPDGFDPKFGLTEDQYEAMVSRDHPPTLDELQRVALSSPMRTR